jgi:hypothetical protein
MSKCHYSFGRCRRPKRSYYCSWEYHIAAQTPGASRKSTTSHDDATRPLCRHIFRDAHFEIIQFCLFVSSFSFFIVLLLSFISEILCQPLRGGWNNTRWPQKFGVEVASRLEAVELRLIFLSFSFFFFILSFSFNSSLLLQSSGNRTAKSVPFPFHSRDFPERYLLLFLSPTFFLCSCVSKPMRSYGKWPLPSNVRYARTHRHFTATTSVNFPVGEIQCKQTGAMIVHLSF